MKCTQCNAVVERTEMPFHIRKQHDHNNISSTPTQPKRNVSRRQDSTTTEPTSAITRPERETFQKEIQDIVHAFTALPDHLRQVCGESVGNMPVLGVSPSAVARADVMIYVAIRRYMRTPSHIFNYALQRNEGRSHLFELVV